MNKAGIRGVVPTVGFPMDMDAWGKGRLWHISHKTMAVEAGLGKMGKNRMVIHPKFGNHILLESILIDADLDVYDRPIEYNPEKAVGLRLKINFTFTGRETREASITIDQGKITVEEEALKDADLEVCRRFRNLAPDRQQGDTVRLAAPNGQVESAGESPAAIQVSELL